MFLLDCDIKPYAWGSFSAIAELCGRPSPSPGPEAELWMGAHPLGASRIELASGRVSLRTWIDENPQAALGPSVATRYGRLPFLLKLLAAQKPLSLQVHPSLLQAKAGFAREEQEGIRRDADNRNYKDDNHKPELLVALGPFEALSGFRPWPEARALVLRLAVPELSARVERAVDVRSLFADLLSAERATVAALAPAFQAACAREAALDDSDAGALSWAAALAVQYPGDPGAIASLLLRHVTLSAGQGIYLGAGNLHAYLRGLGVEIMASSDNVLRGGLTPKHVDQRELMAVIDFAACAPSVLAPDFDDAVETVFDTPAPEFRLSRIALRAGAPLELACDGPEIVLVTHGEVRGTSSFGQARLAAGASAFVPASAARYQLAGEGEVYRARVGG